MAVGRLCVSWQSASGSNAWSSSPLGFAWAAIHNPLPVQSPEELSSSFSGLDFRHRSPRSSTHRCKAAEEPVKANTPSAQFLPTKQNPELNTIIKRMSNNINTNRARPADSEGKLSCRLFFLYQAADACFLSGQSGCFNKKWSSQHRRSRSRRDMLSILRPATISGPRACLPQKMLIYRVDLDGHNAPPINSQRRTLVTPITHTR